MKKSAILFSLLFSIFLLNVSVWGQITMSATSSQTQNFDALVSTGSATFTNNSTIPNWYSQRTGTGTTIVADTGANNAGNLYSYGSTGSNERALGTLGSGNAAAGNFAHGVLLQNTSAVNITTINVSYTLEQWRNAAATAQNITVYYQKSTSPITSLTPNNNTSWTQVSGLTLSSPITGGTAGALNGNLAANRVSANGISLNGLSLAPNEYIMIKWEDPDHAGTDHGLAIDDVTIDWVVDVPVSDVDLTIARETFDTSVSAGNTVEFTLTVANSGTTTASNVGATFTVPSSLTYTDSTVSGGFSASESGGVVTFSGGTIGAGSSVTLAVRATANAAGTKITSLGSQTVVDPANTITETDETNNSANGDVEIRVRFQSPVVGLNGRPNLAQLLAEIEDIDIDRDFSNFEKVVRLNQNLTDENTDIVVPTDVYLDFSIYTISGTANITFGSLQQQLGGGNGAGFKTANLNGLGDAEHPGSIQLSGTRNFNGSTDATFYGNVNLSNVGLLAQNAYGLPTETDVFEIDNAAGVNIYAPFNVNGDLYLTNGVINNGENTITLAESARNNGDNFGEGNALSYVNGAVEKRILFFGGKELGLLPCYIFPVGTTGGDHPGYSPMRMCWSPINVPSSLKARAFDTNSPAVSTPSLSRYWQLDETGDVELDLEFFWVEGDEAAILNATDLRIFRNSFSVCTTASNCTVDLAANKATINNVTDFSPWTVAEFVPTAANAEVGGKVLDSRGNAIANALVLVTDQNGAVRTARTNSFGNYQISELESGRTYTFTAQSRSTNFAAQIVTIQENVTDLNITAID